MRRSSIKRITLFFPVFFFFLCRGHAQGSDVAYLDTKRSAADTQSTLASVSNPAFKANVALNLADLLQSNKPQQRVLLYTRRKQPVTLYFFPGTSNKKALVVGGIHGPESSAIELAETLVEQLSGIEKPYYNVIIIPCLFPDNAELALRDKEGRLENSTGRHSSPDAPDPNRQMPAPGNPFRTERPFDAFARKIEPENKALLTLLQDYQPHRVLSLHSIRDRTKAGIFADPRTDCRSRALGFGPDNELALLLAEHVNVFGGSCPGNRLDKDPTAVYHLDPPVAAVGRKQVRRYQVTAETGKAKGVSLGTWCSTAVCDPDTAFCRPAIRTLTLEFPGYKKVAEYSTKEERESAAIQREAYTSAIRHYFLHSFFVEGDTTEGKLSAMK